MKRTLRIALALSPCGSWATSGWGYKEGESESDEVLMDNACETFPDNRVTKWIEVEVEFPENEAIKGNVL